MKASPDDDDPLPVDLHQARDPVDGVDDFQIQELRDERVGIVHAFDLEMHGAARPAFEDVDGHDVAAVRRDDAGHRVEGADAVGAAADDRDALIRAHAAYATRGMAER